MPPLPGRFQPEVSESVLVPLVNQFSMMQQQMFDQFQQAMGMLVQMFGTMHREQMEVIREELDRLHELSRELQELKDELARSSGRPSPSQSEPAAAPAAAHRIAMPAAPADARQPPCGGGMPAAEAIADRRPVEAPAASAGRPAAAAPAEAPSGRGPRTLAAGRCAGATAADGLRSPRRTASADGAASGPAPPGRRLAGARPAPRVRPATEQDAVPWIHQRIQTIQQRARDPLAEDPQADPGGLLRVAGVRDDRLSSGHATLRVNHRDAA